MDILKLNNYERIKLVNNKELNMILSYVQSESIFFDDKRLLSIDEINNYKSELFITIDCVPLFDLHDNNFIIYNLNDEEFQIYDISDDFIVKRNIIVDELISELENYNTVASKNMKNKFILNNINYDIKNTKLGIECKNNEIILYPEISAKTNNENIDGEVSGISLYHEDGINTHISNIEDLKGKKFTWNNEVNEFGEYAGIVYVLENEVITQGEIEIIDIKDNKAIIKWSGLVNVLWNKDFGRNIPFETIFEVEIPTEIKKIDTFNIWGRELDIKIVYDCYDNEEVINNQIKAYQEFVKNNEIIINDVYKQLESYCKENYKDQIEDDFDNIFKYIMPKTLYIKRNEEDRVVAILCNFKFDSEHGLAIVIKNEQVVNIGNQDIIL